MVAIVVEAVSFALDMSVSLAKQLKQKIGERHLLKTKLKAVAAEIKVLNDKLSSAERKAARQRVTSKINKRGGGPKV